MICKQTTSTIIVALAASGFAAPTTFDPFTVTTPNTNGTTRFNSVPLSGMDPSRTYTTYKVTFDYAAASRFNSKQQDSIFEFGTKPATASGGLDPTEKYYAYPGPSIGIDISHGTTPSGGGYRNPGKLSWYGVFYNDEVTRTSNGNVTATGGQATYLPGTSDLFFNYAQFKPYTTTTWSNVSIELDDNPIVNSAFSGSVVKGTSPVWDRPWNPEGGETQSTGNRKNNAYDLRPFTVDQSGIYQISTYTDPLSNGTGSQWYGCTFIYADSFSPTDQFTNLLATDGPFNGGYSDQPTIMGMELEAGRQYFMVQSIYTSSGRGGVYTGLVHGVGNLTFAPVPEPGMMLALAGGCAALLRRRRRA